MKRFIVLWSSQRRCGGMSTSKIHRGKKGLVMPIIEDVLKDGGTVIVLQRERNPWNQEHAA